MVSEDISEIVGVFLFISIISIVSVTLGILILGTGNDYGIGVLYDVEEQLEADGVITSPEVKSITEDINQTALSWLGYIDHLWLLAYVVASLLLFGSAYYAKRLGFFSFTNFMYIGVMMFLVVLDIVTIVNDWFFEQVLLNILPTAAVLIPKFMFFLDNIGIIVTIQIVLCLVLNIIDLDFVSFNIRKRKEQEAMKTEEVL